MSNEIDYAIVCDPTPFPDHAPAVENDATGVANQINYAIVNRGCAGLGGLPCGLADAFGITSDGEAIDKTYTLENTGEGLLEIGTILVSGPGFSIVSQASPSVLAHGETADFVVRFTPGILPFGDNSGTIIVPTNSGDSPCTFTPVATNGQEMNFDQADGPFVFPPGAFANNDGTLFFTDQTITGDNAQKYVQIPNNPNNFDCSPPGSFGNPPDGRILTLFGGLVTYDIPTATYTGNVYVDLSREGLTPSGSGPILHITALSIPELFNSLFAAGGAFGSEYYFESTAPGVSYSQQWISLNNNGGYFVVGWLNSIYCPGYSVRGFTAGFITVWDLDYAVARTGEPARTQRLTGFDSGTRTYTGNKSRAVFTKTIPDGWTTLNGFYTFLVTPDVGDPYRTYVQSTQTVVPGNVETFNVEYPTIVDADVYLEAVTFDQFPSVFDDFESYTAGTYAQLPGIGSWPNESVFDSTPPNSDAWDDFEDYSTGSSDAGSVVTSLSTGHGWVGPGVFDSKSDTDAYDDFETYPAGAVTDPLNKGFGWAGVGTFDIAIVYDAYDDFESYTVGHVTTPLNGGSGDWVDGGEFA